MTDQAVLARLAPESRGHVVVADLPAQGITDYGKLRVAGFGPANPPAEAELFFEDEPMTLARWPNRGFRGVKAKQSDQVVIVDTDRMARWTAESDPWVFAYWQYDWAELYEPLAGVDAARQALLRSANIRPVFGLTPKEARWYGFNLLSELNAPGEYYLDRVHGLLYFWPPRRRPAVLSIAEDLILRRESLLRDLSRFHVRGLPRNGRHDPKRKELPPGRLHDPQYGTMGNPGFRRHGA